MMNKLDDVDVTTQVRKSPESREILVPSYCTLSGFTASMADRKGLHIGRLDALTELQIRTRNTLYQVTVLEPTEWKIVVQGGRFFPTETFGYLCGSGFGGTLLKVAWIGVGLCCEISTDSLRVVTSPVEEVNVVRQELPGPF